MQTFAILTVPRGWRITSPLDDPDPWTTFCLRTQCTLSFCTDSPKYPENGHFWVFCENREKWGFLKPRKWRKPESGAQICGDPRRIIYCLDTRSGPQKRGFWGFCENPCFGGTANRVRTPCAGGVSHPVTLRIRGGVRVHRHRSRMQDVSHPESVHIAYVQIRYRSGPQKK